MSGNGSECSSRPKTLSFTDLTAEQACTIFCIAEWAVSNSPKDGGVAPQWAGKPPRKALTPQRAFLEDRRASLLADNPDLRLLTCEALSAKRCCHLQ